MIDPAMPWAASAITLAVAGMTRTTSCSFASCTWLCVNITWGSAASIARSATRFTERTGRKRAAEALRMTVTSHPSRRFRMLSR